MKIIASIIAAALLAVPAASAQQHLKSVNKDYFDNNTAAGTDFYRHVNAGWQQAHPLTPEYARYSQFDLLADRAEEQVKEIVTSLAATNPEPGSVAYKVATVYTLAMDSVRRNAEGAAPILAGLRHIEETPDADVDELLLWLHASYANPFFNAGPMEDLADSNRYAMYISGGGLGMSDRDYYLLDDPANKKVREAYKKLITTQMRNAGYSRKDADRIMRNVMKIETALADSTWTREQSRNIPAMFNPRSLDQLKEMYPHVDWDRYFTETMGIDAPEQVIVTEINTVKQADNLIASLTPREKKDYFLWNFVSDASGRLSDAFSDANFEFSRVLTGATEQRPRWKRALAATEGALGEAVGELYVEKYFPESSKEYMVGLVENLRTALGKHLINLPWMSDETKLNAIKKLNAFTVKIGYPDTWKDYSTMEIDPAKSYYDNMHEVDMWHQRDILSRWGKPVDKTLWGMTPQTVNAYYNPMANEIVFPAGILQAPYFDPEASDAENYGAIGVVIGHEMTHGFDDQGRNFDAQGNMSNWWTPEDAERFEALTQGLVKQFGEVEVLPGLFANGEYTLGENIADQGGLRVARTAFLDSQRRKGVDGESAEALIDGVSPMQAFYLNYANIWAANTRPEEVRNRTVSDVHSLPENRVNVSLRNIGPFFEAFGIGEGEPLWRPAEERVIIW